MDAEFLKSFMHFTLLNWYMKAYAIAFSAMLVFGGILSYLPYAEAMPLVGLTASPGTDVAGVDRDLRHEISAAAAIADPTTVATDMWAVWYCPAGACLVDVSSSADCVTSLLLPVTNAMQKKYILRFTADGTPATATQNANGVTGGGPSIIVVDPNYGNQGTHTLSINNLNGVVSGATVEWVELVQGAQTDQTVLAGLYLFAVCGTLGTGGPDSTFTPFIVETAVGGEILPINTSALLLAGLTTNALWILPALAVIAGAGIAVLTFQLNRRTI